MCMVEMADGPLAFVKVRTRKAAKEHRCYECRRPILLGEEHVVTSYVEYRGETPSRHRTCRHCHEASRWLVHECSGFLFGGVLEDLEEHLREEGWAYAGAKALGLGRLIVGMRRQWRKKDGTLVPLPRVTNGKAA